MNTLDSSKFKYLQKINNPNDLKKIPLNQLHIVCDEVREFLIDTITQTGGHFGSGLGSVELIVALHYVYDTPTDKLIFDTGHQGYPHKVLTERRDLMHTIRKKGGISGFLKRSESEYDCFGAGHASTSISAALGIATARDLQNKDFKVLAIIGDGAMTGGLAFEGMNNCGVQKRDITVILNDNNVSIDQNVSALSNYFNELFASNPMQKLRKNVWELTGKMENLGDRFRKVLSRLEGGVKSVVTPGSLFEAMGFNYFGPLNGHNVQQLVKMFRLIKEFHGPILVHVITKKGKGYAPAEKDAHHFHAIGKIDKDTGCSIPNAGDNNLPPQYYKVFGKALVELCRMSPKLVGITAAMAEGTGLDELEREMPERFFDVGIAEGHAVTFAAGLASEGIIPVCAIYSTFLQRAFDNISHDCSLQNLHVIFAVDRAGIVGADGSTHHGLLDLAFLRCINKIIIAAPKDEQELRDLLYSAVFHYTQCPVAIRFPRGRSLGVKMEFMKQIPLGTWEILRDGSDIAILAVGNMVNESMKAATFLEDSNISATVINARFIKPLDTKMLDFLCSKFSKIITVEDGTIVGGFGSAVNEYITANHSKKVDVFIHGIPEKQIEHGSQAELLKEIDLDAFGIAKTVMNFILKQNLEKIQIEELVN